MIELMVHFACWADHHAEENNVVVARKTKEEDDDPCQEDSCSQAGPRCCHDASRQKGCQRQAKQEFKEGRQASQVQELLQEQESLHQAHHPWG